MKNRFTAVLLLLAGLAMAAGIVLAQVKKGNYRPAELGSVRQAAPVEMVPDSNYEVAAYSVPAAELSEGEGRQEIEGHARAPCASTSVPPCHARNPPPWRRPFAPPLRRSAPGV